MQSITLQVSLSIITASLAALISLLTARIFHDTNNTRINSSLKEIVDDPPAKASGNDVAVFWDYENVRITANGNNSPLADALVKKINTLGHPVLQKVYANWRSVGDAENQALFARGFETIQVAMKKTNSTDGKLIVDCMDAVRLFPSIGRFVIITGDKDFIVLVNWLRQRRKEVTIIGNASIASEHLVQSANKFYSLESIQKKATEKPKEVPAKSSPVIPAKVTSQAPTNSMSYETAVECFLQAVEINRASGRSWTRLPVLDNLMRSNPKFKYKGIKHVSRPDRKGNFSAFSQFFDAVAASGLITTRIVNGEREVMIDGEPKKQDTKSTIAKKAGVSPAKNPDLEASIALLRQAIKGLEASKKIILLTGIKDAMLKENPRFSEKALGFSSFKAFMTDALPKATPTYSMECNVSTSRLIPNKPAISKPKDERKKFGTVREGVTIENERGEVTLPADHWLMILKNIEGCITDTDCKGNFKDIRDTFFEGRRNRIFLFPPSIDIPIMYTFIYQGLFVQETRGYYKLAEDYESKKGAFIKTYKLDMNDSNALFQTVGCPECGSIWFRKRGNGAVCMGCGAKQLDPSSPLVAFSTEIDHHQDKTVVNTEGEKTRTKDDLMSIDS